MSEEEQVVDSGKVKKAKIPDAIKEQLKRKPVVQLVEGVPSYISQLSGVAIQKRYGLPVLGKDKKPKSLLGAFKDAGELIDWLGAQHNSGKLSKNRYERALSELTHYSQISQTERSKFEASVGVNAGIGPVAPKAKKPKAPKAAKKEAEAKPAAASKKEGGGGYVVFPSFEAMDVDGTKAKSISEALGITSGEVVRMEVVTVPSSQLVLFKRLEAPGAGLLKQIGKHLGVAIDSLNIAKERGRDTKYSAVIGRKALKGLRKTRNAKQASAAKKEVKHAKQAKKRTEASADLKV